MQITWKTAQIVNRCIAQDLAAMAAIQIEDTTAREVWEFYTLFLQYYLEKQVKAYAFVHYLTQAVKYSD